MRSTFQTPKSRNTSCNFGIGSPQSHCDRRKKPGKTVETNRPSASTIAPNFPVSAFRDQASIRFVSGSMTQYSRTPPAS